ncbi:hypothetical protein G6N76_11085 [Rhizobium daejeonense]|uniref:Pentapeptide repeat-containing protein n=1 Tax=Rhizobium daejeonense TaxID=240521 RepID=A0A6M1RS88_9HYPH|nr:hypothetical protein [Rhizobium daejeonense]NGO64222.1 hypothetical protein [Rhizobium daejeonense]
MAGNDRNKEDRPVSDWPNMDPRWWMLAAVTVTFGLAIPGAIFAAVAVFSQKMPETAHDMVTVIVPFGTIVLALITFFTVVWRGLLTDQQVKEQRRQNNAKDDEMLTKLLVDGAGLLGDENEAKRMAGVSALNTVATAPNGSYSSNAMEILLEFWEHNYRADNTTRAVRNTSSALAQAVRLGRRANTGIYVFEDERSPNLSDWSPPPGAQFVFLRGGFIGKNSFAKLDRNTRWTMNQVSLEGCIIEAGSWEFFTCRFKGCTIATPPLKSGAENWFHERSSFEDCDFSGAAIDANDFRSYVQEYGSLRVHNNFYYEDDPPVSNASIDWLNELLCLPASMRAD